MMERFNIDACGMHIAFSLLLRARLVFEEEGEMKPVMDWSNVQIKSHPVQHNVFQSVTAFAKESDFKLDLLGTFKAFMEQVRWVTDKGIAPGVVEMRLDGRSEVSIIKNLYVQH